MKNESDRDCVVFNSAVFTGWVNGTGRNLPVSFCGVTQDTRNLKPGMLYVALKGHNFDGHDFVSKALESGAAAALVDQKWASRQETCAWPLLCVTDTRRALLDAASGWRKRSKAIIIGITGSSGKTTTREIAAAIFAVGGKVCCTRDNFNNDIGLPLSILAMQPDCDFGIFELGTNHPGEISLLAEVLEPDAGIITSVGSAHIENFGSIEAIAKEKGALFAHLKDGGFSVLSMEMEHFNEVAACCTPPPVTVSLLNSTADYFAEIRDEISGRLSVTERDTGICVELESRLPGKFNLYNVLLAYAAARRSGIRALAATEALDQIRIPGMRWQKITLANGAHVINDAYNANPESMRAVLNVFGNIKSSGRKVLVLGDMLELGDFAESLHRSIGMAVAAINPDFLYLVGPMSGSYISAGALCAGFSQENIFCFNDAFSAGRKLAGLLHKDDLILLKASRGIHLEEVLDAL